MATLFEDELLLPGVITEIIPNYSEGYDTSLFGTTESVAIIGTAFNGPVGKPVAVYSPEHGKYIFGDSFDPKTRREASLVAEIYDAWDRGCRTIYAIRVSGKDMFKDFELAVETNLKLRVSSMFPSNDNKDCYFVFDAVQGSGSTGTFKVFKPASKATIAEKKQGLVDSSESVLVTEMDLEAYSLTKNDKLSDAIKYFNSNKTNNGIRLAIVDENGADVTNTSKEAHAISIGALFPGIYTVARNTNAKGVVAVTDLDYVNNETMKLYKNYEGHLWKKLLSNTDINAPYPIYSISLKNLTEKLMATGVVVDEKYEWLKTPGNLNKIYLKDTVDYEEVELSPFEIYKRLGSGFAKTAKVEEIKKGDKNYYKVIETPHGDENRVMEIADGIYSILENYSTDYRVLSCANSETKINSRLPKKEEFRKSVGASLTLKDNTNEVINANCKINNKDFTAHKEYNFSVVNEELDKVEVIENLITNKKYMRVPVISSVDVKPSEEIVDGQLVLLIDGFDGTLTGTVVPPVEENGGTEGEAVVTKAVVKKAALRTAVRSGEVKGYLHRYNKKAKAFEVVDAKFFTKEDENGAIKDRVAITVTNEAGEISLMPMSISSAAAKNNTLEFTKEDLASENGKYVLTVSGDLVNINKIDNGALVPFVALRTVLAHEEGDDYTIAYVESVPVIDPATKTKSLIKVISSKLEWCNYEELVQDLNEENVLKNMFSFGLKDPMLAPEDVAEVLKGEGVDRGETTYDTNKYIPYTTADNFARQLAQHAMYTSLKTYPTHAIIGCEKLVGVTLNAIAERVDAVTNMNLDLFAKKPNGNNMLDRDNMPCPIGRCLSVPFMQYGITTGNGYSYISNGAAGYAGMISTLPAGRSSTNQPISLPSLAYELSNYQLGKLTAKGMVVCKVSNKGTVIADGVTQAPVDTAFVRLSTVKVVNIVDKILRAAIEPFIGLQDNLANRNSLETAIKSELNKVSETLIRGYDFKIQQTADNQRLGIVKIDYVIMPINEIREVRNQLTVK